MGYRKLVTFLLALTCAACGAVDRRVDPDDPDEVGGANLRSQDIRTMADRMARDIIDYGILESRDPAQRISFYISSLRNDTSDTIDKEIILTKVRTGLQRGLGRRVMVLDRSKEGMEAIQAERRAKREKALAANPAMKGNLAGSDYVLKGTIKERRLQEGSLKSVYYLTTFELTDLETGELAWTNDYEAKFLSEKSVISR